MNRLDELIFTAVSKPLLTEFGIHHGWESCALDCVQSQHSDFSSVVCYALFYKETHSNGTPAKHVVVLPTLSTTSHFSAYFFETFSILTRLILGKLCKIYLMFVAVSQ